MMPGPHRGSATHHRRSGRRYEQQPKQRHDGGEDDAPRLRPRVALHDGYDAVLDGVRHQLTLLKQPNAPVAELHSNGHARHIMTMGTLPFNHAPKLQLTSTHSYDHLHPWSLHHGPFIIRLLTS